MNIKKIIILSFFFLNYQIANCQTKSLSELFMNLEKTKQNDSIPSNLYKFLYKYRVHPYGFIALQNLKSLNLNDSITIGKIYFHCPLSDYYEDDSDTIRKETFYCFIYNKLDKTFHLIIPSIKFRNEITDINPENSLTSVSLYDVSGFKCYSFFIQQYSNFCYYEISNFLQKNNLYYRKLLLHSENNKDSVIIRKNISEQTIEEYFKIVEKLKNEVNKVHEIDKITENEIQNIMLPKR